MINRIKAAVMDPTIRQVAQATAILAAVFLMSALCFFGIRRVMAATGDSIVLVSPTGGTVFGNVTLEAHTVTLASSVVFEVWNGSTVVWSANGTADSTQTVWQSGWDSHLVTDGIYEIRARATSSDSTTYGSGPTSVTVSNGYTLMTHSVNLTYPMNGASLSGTTDFAATTDSPADYLDFVVRDPTGASVIEVDAFSSDGIGWVTTWNSSSLSSGSYSIIARASFGGTLVESTAASVIITSSALGIGVTSPAAGSTVFGTVSLTATTTMATEYLQFKIRNSAGALVTDMTGTMVSGSGGTSWSASWNAASVTSGSYSVVAASGTIASPAINFNVGGFVSGLTVSVTSPGSGSTVSGPVSLTARTSSSVSLVRFEVRQEGSPTSHTVYGGVSADILSWTGYWDTTGAVEGWYTVRGIATLDATTFTSTDVRFYFGSSAAPPAVTPTVAINHPVSGASLSGTLDLIANTSSGVGSLLFTISPLATDIAVEPITMAATASDSTAMRWVKNWDSRGVPNGDYQMVATVYDGTVSAASASVVVTVNNGTSATVLTVELLTPTTATISGPIVLKAVSRPETGTASLRFIVTGLDADTLSGSLLGTHDASLGAWIADWNPASFGVGRFSIRAEATDMSGTIYNSAARELSFDGTGSTTEPTTEPVTATVRVTAPTAGQTVSGTWNLAASTVGTVERVVFKAYQVGTSTVVSIDSGMITDGSWKAAWDSIAVPDGEYGIKAVASASGTVVAQSNEVRFTVRNGTTTEPTITVRPLSAVNIIEPISNSVAGSVVDLVAETFGTAEEVVFTIKSAEGTVRANVTGRIVTGTDRWRGSWGTLAAAGGKYAVVATARAGDRTFSSGIVYLTVTVPGTSTTEPEAVVAPVTTAGETTTDGQEAVAAVFVVRPAPGPVSGIVSLAARSEGKMTGVRFIVRRAGTTNALISRVAVYDPSKLLWLTYWNSTGVVPDKYIVLAVGKDAYGNEVRGVPIEVTITAPASAAETAAIKPVFKEITQIPLEAVREAVQEVPEGTTTVTMPVLPARFQQAVDGLSVECDAAGIPAEKCRDWLAAKYRANECRQAGIVTREECVAYLYEINGGSIPECAGQSKEFCSEYLAKRTGDLISNSRLDELEKEAFSRIGTVLKYGRTAGVQPEEPVEGAAEVVEEEALPNVLVESLPMKDDKEVSLRMHASPAFAQIDETKSRRYVPAVLMIDSDGDGLPDDAEKRLGTDPDDIDSDGDGYTDAEELRNGYDPLGLGRLGDEAGAKDLAPVDAAVLAGVPMEQPMYAGDLVPELTIGLLSEDEGGEGPAPYPDGAASFANDDGGASDTGEQTAEEPADRLRFAGKAAPGEVVTIFIYSYLPMVLTTTADESGNWEYDLETGLVDGEHEVYVTVTDETGKIKSKGNPLAFFVSEATAVTAEEFFGQPVERSAMITPQDAVSRVFNWYIIGAIGLIIVALSTGIIIVLRPRKPKFEDAV